MPRLVLLSEGMTGRVLDLMTEKSNIGRVEDNTFQIPEASVSSHHCEVWVRGNDALIKDLNSTNGTFIEGQPVTTEALLKPGQILRLGQVQMRLESGAASASASSAAAQKKVLDHTMVIPQGVKLNELEKGGAKPVKFENTSPFGKRSNKTNLIFLVIGIVLSLLIIGLLVYAFQQQGQMGTGE